MLNLQNELAARNSDRDVLIVDYVMEYLMFSAQVEANEGTATMIVLTADLFMRAPELMYRVFHLGAPGGPHYPLMIDVVVEGVQAIVDDVERQVPA